MAPRPLGRLVGRDEELAALATLATHEDVRLLTVTGPGGVGKTRLALAMAERIREAFPGGVTFVSLAAVTDPSRVLPALARACDLADDQPPGQHIVQQLAIALSGKSRLLILDNLEQVAAAGPAIAELAGHCSNVTTVMTSRFRLQLGGEYEFPVSPLPVPEIDAAADQTAIVSLAENPSVALFLARAIAANPHFALTEANADAVARICRRLDGLPLAIELAAARSVVLSPQAILVRLTSRLHVLGDGPADAPARLRSMHDAVTWSLDLLADDALRLFDRLSIVAGPITEEIAEALAGDASGLSAFTSLIEAGLLQRLPQTSADDDPAAPTRWRMLETVREVGRERLEEQGEIDAAYLLFHEWLNRLIQRANPEVTAGQQDVWFPRLEEHGESFRAVIGWAIRTERPEHALNLMVGSLWFYWSMRQWVRGERPVLEAALTMATTHQPPIEPSLWARALFTDALYLMQTGDYGRARARFLETLQVCDQLTLPLSSVRRSSVLLNLGVIDSEQGDYASARRSFEEVLTIRRELGDPGQIAKVLNNLGNVANLQGDSIAAIGYLDEALLLLRQVGDRRTMAYCLLSLGEVAASQGRTTEALISFDQALGVFRQTADLPGEGITLINLAAAALAQRDVARAAAALAEALTQQRETRTPAIVSDALDGTAATALAAGRPELAPRYLAVATAFRTATGITPTPPVRRRADQTTGSAIAALGRPAYDAALLASRPLTTQAAMTDAIDFLTTIGLPGSELVMESASPDRALSATRSDAAVALTQRQREVLRLLVAGSTDPEIGEELGISSRTVESHVLSILNKLRVHARTAAVAYAVRHGLI